MNFKHICKCNQDYGYRDIGRIGDDKEQIYFLQCLFCGQIWMVQFRENGQIVWSPYICNLSKEINNKINIYTKFLKIIKYFYMVNMNKFRKCRKLILL